MADAFVTIARFRGLTTAQFYTGLLQSNGVHAFLPEECTAALRAPKFWFLWLEAQIRLVETLANGKVKGILLAPVDARALAAPVEQAARGGVPTVVFDSALDGDKHVSFIATDNRRGGELAGAKLGELMGGKGKVVMLRFQEGSASTMAREAGFLATLAEKYPAIEIISDNQYAPSLGRCRVQLPKKALAVSLSPCLGRLEDRNSSENTSFLDLSGSGRPPIRLLLPKPRRREA